MRVLTFMRPSNLADSSARCGEGDCFRRLPTGRGRVLDVWNPWRRVSGWILAGRVAGRQPGPRRQSDAIGHGEVWGRESAAGRVHTA